MFGQSRRQPMTTTSTPRRNRRRGLFGGKRTRREAILPATTSNRNNGERGGGIFHRTDPNRRAGGLKGALHNPNTTRDGRRRAKMELRAMGRGNEARGHPSFTSRIKRMLGIRSRRPARAEVYNDGYYGA